MANERIHLSESQRALPPKARQVAELPPDERIEVTVLLRRRAALPTAPAGGAFLSHDQLQERCGAHPDAVEAVGRFAAAHSLEVVEADAGRRMVRLEGAASAMQAAFGVQLARYTAGRSRFRSHPQPVSLPAELGPIVEGVFGLDTRPQARPHFRYAKGRPGKGKPRAGAQPLTPLEVAQLYDFPPGLDGTGQCIALIELGGGFVEADLQTYFGSLGLPAPVVTAVSVLGGQNDPTGPTRDANGEVMLDIEVAGAVAPRAQIVVYFAPNTDAGFLQAVSTAVHDRQRKPAVVSISWGGPEPDWAAQTLQAIDGVCQEAAQLGVTVCAAAGDNGATDDPQGQGPARADFPASSPYVLACGGTRLEGRQGAITAESVWNDAPGGGATGGGVSAVFPLPAYQAGAQVPPSINPGHAAGRGVPDVAGDADPNTGYITRVDGQDTVVGGTSAVAPLWAGLLARIAQHRGAPVGWLQPALYRAAPAGGLFRDVTTGDNGGYSAGPGWDACTGWGSPRGAPLLGALAPGS